jgi:hypothetical protein
VTKRVEENCQKGVEKERIRIKKKFLFHESFDLKFEFFFTPSHNFVVQNIILYFRAFGLKQEKAFALWLSEA